MSSAPHDDHSHARGVPLPETFFVGRRPFEAAELYAVSLTEVERISSEFRFGTAELDWHAPDAAALELGYALLARLAEQPPSQWLVSRFVREVLARLPDDGFVLSSEEIWHWLRWASAPQDWGSEETPHRSLRERLRRPLRGGGT